MTRPPSLPEPRRSPTLDRSMRPLLVLLLVAGAVAALLFALTLLSDEGGGPTEEQIVMPSAVPTLAAEQTNGELRVPSRMAEEIPPVATGRTVVEGDEEPHVAADGFIAGIVVDSEEAPVEGAVVQLIRQKGVGQLATLQQLLGNLPAPRPVKEVSTDVEGSFRFDRVSPGGDWALVVQHGEFSRVVVGPIEVRSTGGATERIVLDRGFEIFGVVTAAGSGMPLGGAHVVLDNAAASFLPSTRPSPDRLETVSGEDGSYTIANIPAANRTLTVSMEGFATQIDQRRVNFAGGGDLSRRIDVELLPGELIAGRVIGPDGAGVPGVQVDALGSGAPSSRGSTLSNQGGEFLIPDLAAGRYTLRVTAAGYDCDPLPADAGERDVLVKLHGRGGLMGTVVRPTGGPVRDFHVKVRQLHPTNVALGALTLEKGVSGSKDGSFVVEGLKAGSYVVQADARGFASSFSTAVDVEEGLTTPGVQVVMSRGGTIVGRVLNPETKQGIAGVKVTTQVTNWVDSDLTNLFDAVAPTALTRATVATDDEGRFEIARVTPETYQVAIRKGGYTVTILNGVEVGADVKTDLGEITLARGGTVRGTAHLAGGDSAANVRVSLQPLDAGPSTRGATVRSDAEGRFLFENIAGGRYSLSCALPAKPGAGPFATMLEMEKSKVEIEVVEGAECVQDIHMGSR